MIKSITSLRGTCEVCGERADYQVVRTHKDNKGFIYEMASYFCIRHFPEDARKEWQNEMKIVPD